MRIDRCVCTDRTFASLLGEARRRGLTLGALMRRTGAGCGCTTCRPYLREAMRSGQVVFDRLLSGEDEDDKAATLAGSNPKPKFRRAAPPSGKDQPRRLDLKRSEEGKPRP